MAFSNQRAVSDGTLQTIILSIAFFDKSEIRVYVDDALQVVDADYIWATSNSVQFPQNLPTGATVIIRRVTDISEMRHVFTAGAQFTNQTLDEDYTQILHIAQESVEGSYTTELFNDLDMHGYQVRNLGNATLPGDAVPLGQVNTIIQNSPDLKRALRVPLGEASITELPGSFERANKVLGFNAIGQPVGVLPLSGSGTELALDLANPSDPNKGANMVALSTVNLISARSLLTAKQDSNLIFHTVGYHAGTMRGGGRYIWSETAPKSLHDGGRFISPTVPNTTNQLNFLQGVGETQPAGFGCFALLNGEQVQSLTYGLSGQSASDESALVQHVVDRNKGSVITFERGYKFAFAGVILDGATYNNTELLFLGTHYQGVRPANKPANFMLAWVGLGIRGVDGVKLTYRGNGQRSLQPDQEHNFNIRLAGVTNFDCPRLYVREFRGDGIYIGQLEHDVNSQTSFNMNFGIVDMANSTEDGRNGMSVIACQGLHMDIFRCYNVGGVVGGIRQPGGFDIEPNFDFQICRDIRIGSVIIHTAGTAGFGVYGKGQSTLGGNVDGVTVGSYNVVNVNPVDGVSAVYLAHCQNIVMTGYASCRRDATHQMDATLRMDNVNQAVIDHTGYGGTYGVTMAQTFRCVNVTLHANVHSYMQAGVRTTYVSRSTVNIIAHDGAANSYVLYTRKFARAVVQENVQYSVTCPKVGTIGTYAIYNESTDAMEFSNCRLVGGDLTGYASFANSIFNCGIGLRRIDVPGVNESVGQPTTGTWMAGDFVNNLNLQMNSSHKMIATGWLRLTSGSNHVANVDWCTTFSSTVAPVVIPA